MNFSNKNFVLFLCKYFKVLVSVSLDCKYLGKNFTFELENDRQTVETSLFFNINFFN